MSEPSQPYDCAGKVAFEQRDQAEVAARRRAGRTAYKCPTCKRWHVGGRKYRREFKKPAPIRLG